MGNFLTIFERSEEIVEPQPDTSINTPSDTSSNTPSDTSSDTPIDTSSDTPSDTSIDTLSNINNEVFDFNFELVDVEEPLEISKKISEKMLKDIFEEIKNRNPVIIEEDNIEIQEESDEVKTISNSQNKKVKIIINSRGQKEVCINSENKEVKTTVKTTTFDNEVKTEIKTQVGSDIKYQNNIPKFYPNITSVPYKFPPYPAPANLYKQNNTIVSSSLNNSNLNNSKPKLSFWGNAFMDTKKLNTQQKFKSPPSLQYSPYALNSGIAFKYKKE